MMWNLAILLKGRSEPIMLNFRGGDGAKAARKLFWSVEGPGVPLIEITDDFHASASVWQSDVLSVIVQNLEGTFEAQAEQSLIQARAQAKVQKKAQADPLLAPPRVMAAGGNGAIRQQ